MYIRYLKNAPNYIITISSNPVEEDDKCFVAEVSYYFNNLRDDNHNYMYKYENNNVVEVANIDLIKLTKIKELRASCNLDILSGFESDAYQGINKHYSFDTEDQTNMVGIISNILLGNNDVIYWKASSETTSYPWTQEEYKTLYHDAKLIKEYKIMQFHTFVGQVNAAITEEEVEAIIW